MMWRGRSSPCLGKSVTVWQFMQRGSLSTLAILRNAASDRARASESTGFVVTAAIAAVPKFADQITAAANADTPRAAIKFVAAKRRIVSWIQKGLQGRDWGRNFKKLARPLDSCSGTGSSGPPKQVLRPPIRATTVKAHRKDLALTPGPWRAFRQSADRFFQEGPKRFAKPRPTRCRNRCRRNHAPTSYACPQSGATESPGAFPQHPLGYDCKPRPSAQQPAPRDV